MNLRSCTFGKVGYYISGILGAATVIFGIEGIDVFIDVSILGVFISTLPRLKSGEFNYNDGTLIPAFGIFKFAFGISISAFGLVMISGFGGAEINLIFCYTTLTYF